MKNLKIYEIYHNIRRQFFSFVGVGAVSTGIDYVEMMNLRNAAAAASVNVAPTMDLSPDQQVAEIAEANVAAATSATVKAVGTGAAPTAAFREHLIDAYIGGTTTFLTMEEKQVGRVLTPVSTYIGNVASGTLFASKYRPESIW